MAINYNFFGRRKLPLNPIASSGLSNVQNATLAAVRFNLSHTFTGLTPGVRVTLVDNLFTEETNGIYKSSIVRTGVVNELVFT